MQVTLQKIHRRVVDGRNGSRVVNATTFASFRIVSRVAMRAANSNLANLDGLALSLGGSRNLSLTRGENFHTMASYKTMQRSKPFLVRNHSKCRGFVHHGKGTTGVTRNFVRRHSSRRVDRVLRAIHSHGIITPTSRRVIMHGSAHVAISTTRTTLTDGFVRQCFVVRRKSLGVANLADPPLLGTTASSGSLVSVSLRSRNRRSEVIRSRTLTVHTSQPEAPGSTTPFIGAVIQTSGAIHRGRVLSHHHVALLHAVN
mmetsp:Transcript_17606/g.35409  ORF Transcript_17606/g.35409 Transcript_17606/m.35409 type:complete len:257 (+) Transcript_17606:1066-1836(+)